METTMKLGDVLTAAELAELRAQMSPEHHAEFDERVAELERDPALLGYIVESWADRAELSRITYFDVLASDAIDGRRA
jgi:hypothetical protein